MKNTKLITLILACALCAALIGAVWASEGGAAEAARILRAAVGLEAGGEPVYRAAELLAAEPAPTPTKPPFIIITPKPSATPEPTPTPRPASGSDITVTPEPATNSDLGGTN